MKSKSQSILASVFVPLTTVLSLLTTNTGVLSQLNTKTSAQASTTGTEPIATLNSPSYQTFLPLVQSPGIFAENQQGPVGDDLPKGQVSGRQAVAGAVTLGCDSFLSSVPFNRNAKLDGNTRFVTDISPGNLDCWLPQPEISFVIPITHPFSNLGAQSLVQNKLLPQESTLTLATFDVDSNAPETCKEVDRVYINGHLITDVLTGENGQWRIQTLKFLTEWLVLPTIPASSRSTMNEYVEGPVTVAPISQTIRVAIDTAGCSFWYTQIDWGAIEIDASKLVPIVLTHGWNASGLTWDTFADRLIADGIPFYAPNWGIFKNANSGYVRIDPGAATLAQDIQATLKAFHTPKVNVITHSKGGLVARWALDKKGAAPYVQSLLTLDTPHHGVDDFRIGMIEILQDGVCFGEKKECVASTKELAWEQVLKTFNYNCTYKPDVDEALTIPGQLIPRNLLASLFYVNCTELSGSIPWPWISYFSFSSGATDIWAVPPESPTYPWRANKKPYPTVSNVDGDFGGVTSHISIASDFPAYCAAIFGFLRYPSKTCNGTALSQMSVQGSQPAVGVEQSAVTTATQFAPSLARQLVSSAKATLQPGIVFTHVVSLSGGGLSTFEAISFKPISLTLVAPGGQVLQGDTLASQTASSYFTRTAGIMFSPDGWMQSFSITPTQSGQWTIQISSTQATSMSLIVGEDNNTFLWAAPSKTQMRPGGSITIQASIIGAGQIISPAVITGFVRISDTTNVGLTFADSGLNGDRAANDGIYTSQFVAPLVFSAVPSQTHATLDVRVFARAGAINRSLTRYVDVLLPAARISSPITHSATDTNNDGLFDILQITPTIYISQPGQLSLSADLVDALGNRIQQVAFSTQGISQSLPVGNLAVPLTFDGTFIRSLSQTDTFKLTNLTLADISDGYIAIETQNNVYTVTIPRGQFAAPQLVLGSASESVADWNNDGKYDALQITQPISWTNAGQYRWAAELFDVQDRHVAWASGQSLLPSGVIALAFTGQDIYSSGFNGPYRVGRMDILQTSGPGVTSTGRIFFTNIYTTQQPYSATQFSNTFINSLPNQTIVVDGAPFSTTLNFGERMRIVTFTASIGQNLSLGINDNSHSTSYSLQQPNGNQIWSFENSGDSKVTTIVYKLPQIVVGGVYTISIAHTPDPYGANSDLGIYTITLSTPAIGSNPVVDSGSGSVNITRTGQRGLMTFAGIAGQVLGIGLETSQISGRYLFTMDRPDGIQQYAIDTSPSNLGFRIPTLTQSGVYTIGIEPDSINTGVYTITLSTPKSGGEITVE